MPTVACLLTTTRQPTAVSMAIHYPARPLVVVTSKRRSTLSFQPKKRLPLRNTRTINTTHLPSTTRRLVTLVLLTVYQALKCLPTEMREAVVPPMLPTMEIFGLILPVNLGDQSKRSTWGQASLILQAPGTLVPLVVEITIVLTLSAGVGALKGQRALGVTIRIF